jgi:NIMA (never in mitosis gene a)-related kinase
VLRKDDQQEYALKKVKMYGLTDKERENAVNEVRILASIKYNKNVILYKEAFVDTQSDCLWYASNT